MFRKCVGKNQKDNTSKKSSAKKQKKAFEITNLEQRLLLSGDDFLVNNPVMDNETNMVEFLAAPPTPGTVANETLTLQLKTSLNYAISVSTSSESVFKLSGKTCQYAIAAGEISTGTDAVVTQDNGTKIVSLKNGAKLLLDSNFSDNGRYFFLSPETTTEKTFTVTIDVTKPGNAKLNAKTVFTVVENNTGAVLSAAELDSNRFKVRNTVSATSGNYEDVIRLQHWFNYNGYRDASGSKLEENGITDDSLAEVIQKFKRAWSSPTAIIDNPNQLTAVEANHILYINAPRWIDGSSLQSKTGLDVKMQSGVSDTFGTVQLLNILNNVKQTASLKWEIGDIAGNSSVKDVNGLYNPDDWSTLPQKFIDIMNSTDIGSGDQTFAEFFKINNDLIRAHWLGQSSVETGNFKYQYEGAWGWNGIKNLCTNPNNTSFRQRFLVNGAYNATDPQWAIATWNSTTKTFSYERRTDAGMQSWWDGEEKIEWKTSKDDLKNANSVFRARFCKDGVYNAANPQYAIGTRQANGTYTYSDVKTDAEMESWWDGEKNFSWARIKQLCKDEDSSFRKRFCKDGVYNDSNPQWVVGTTVKTDAQMKKWWDDERKKSSSTYWVKGTKGTSYRLAGVTAEYKFNYAYARRLGNGDIPTNDGYNFRGHGLKQLTFRDNYTEFKNWLQNKGIIDFTKPENAAKDPVANPDIIATDNQMNMLSALWFSMKTSKYLSSAKLGMNSDAIEKVTKALNGGTNGLKERYANTVKFYNALLSNYSAEDCQTVLDSVHQSGMAVELRLAKTATAKNIADIIALYNSEAAKSTSVISLQTVYLPESLLNDITLKAGTLSKSVPFLGLNSLDISDSSEYLPIHLVFGLKSDSVSTISAQNQAALNKLIVTPPATPAPAPNGSGMQTAFSAPSQVKKAGLSGTIVNLLQSRLPQELTIGSQKISLEKLVGSNLTSLFDCDSAIREYLASAGSESTYEGLGDAIEKYISDRVNIDLDILSQYVDVTVTYDDTTNRMNFNICLNVTSSHSLPISLGAADSGFGTTLDNNLELQFNADIDFGIDLKSFLQDPQNNNISYDDIYYRINDLSVSGSASVSAQEGKSFTIGSIEFEPTAVSAELSAGSAWYICKSGQEDYTLTLSDIISGNFEWENATTGSFTAELGLSVKGKSAQGEASFLYTDENIFKEGDEEIGLSGALIIPDGIDIGNGILKLGKTELSFDSSLKLVVFETESASLKIGNDLLNISLTDSTDEDDVAVYGAYNYETGEFNFDLDNWDMSIKGLIEASGQGLVFKFNDKAESTGREVVGFKDINNVKIIPLDKTLNLTGVDMSVDGQTVKRALSIRDNGFTLGQLSIELSDEIKIGNDLLTIVKPTLIFQNIGYIKGSAGLTGKIGIDTTSVSVNMKNAVKLDITDSIDAGNIALSGSYDLATKRFELNADTTSLNIADGRITSTINGLAISYLFGDNGMDANEEILSVSGPISVTVKLSDSVSKTVNVAPQQLVVNGQPKTRSLSLTGNAFMLGNASVLLTDSQSIGSFIIDSPKLVLQDFSYNSQTDEYTGKLGLAAESAHYNSGSNRVNLAISKTTGDAIELLYDLKNGGFTGTIDRVDFVVKDSSGDEILAANATNVAFTIRGGKTALDMSGVNASIPALSIPSQSLGSVKIADGTVIVTHNGKDYDLSNGSDVTELLKALAGNLIGGDDDVLLTQDAVSKIVTLRDRSTGDEINRWDLASDNEIAIDLGKGVDRIAIDSNIDLGGKNLSIISEYITISNKEIKNVDQLNINADSNLDISALDIIGLLIEAFKIDLNGSSPTVSINYESLINRLLGRSEAVVSVNNSKISAKNVNFTAKINVVGESKGLLPVDLDSYSGPGNQDGKASKFRIPGLTTALASVQAKALVSILNSVITSGKDLVITSDAKVDVKSTAVAKAQEEGNENDGDTTSYDAVVALAIINSKSMAYIDGTSSLDITGNITINASNNTSVTNTANGMPEGSGKAYGGSIGILAMDKETKAMIGSDVEFTKNPAALSLSADSVTTITNDVTAAAGGAKKNNDGNKKTIQDKGGQTSSGKVNVAGAAAVTIVNDSTSATANFEIPQTTAGDLAVNATSKNTITSKANGATVANSDSNPKVGVGVGVALNVVKENTIAAASNISAKSIKLTASNDTTITGEAASGAGASNVGVAGSVAVNTIDQTTNATGGNTLKISGGELSVKADAKLNATAKAKPKDAGAQAEKVGIGASFALNDINVETNATDKGASISGTITALKIDADTNITANSETKAGSSATGNSGVAISPSVAVTVIQSDTKALHSAASTSSVSGDIAITSDSTVKAVTKAGASADGNVAVGASIGVAVIKANNDASVESPLATSSGKIDVTANGNVNSLVNAEATPRSGDNDKDKKADDEANKQLSITRLFGKDKQSANADSTMGNQNSASKAEGGSNSNRVGVSAAVGVNVVTSNNSAKVINGADLSAAGDISVIAKEDVDVITQAVALSFNKEKDSGAKIGAGAGLNVVNKSNSASVSGGAVLNSKNVTVSAEALNSNESAILSVAAAAGMGNGVSVSATTGVNVVNSSTSATIDSDSQIQSNGKADIKAVNKTDIQTLVLAAGVSQNSAGIGAAVVVNVLDSDVTASVAGKVAAKGDVTVSAVNDTTSAGHKFTVFDEPVLGQQNKEVELSNLTAVAAAGGASQGSVGIAGSFIVNNYDLNTQAVVDKGATIDSKGNVTVSADSNTTINNIAGSIGASIKSTGVGVGSDVTILKKNTSAIIGNSSDSEDPGIKAVGNLSVTADSDETILSVAAAVAAANSVAVGVTSSVLVINTNTNATIEDSTQAGETIQIEAADLKIKATDGIDITQVVAGVSASGKVAVGGGAAVLVHKDQVNARIGDNNSVQSSGTVLVDAESSEEMVQIVANVAASGSAAVNGAAVVTNLNENTHASIGESSVNANGGISVAASDETGQISVVGTVAASGGAGVGLGGTVITVNKSTTADVGNGAALRSTGNGSNIIISADSNERLINITAGVAAGEVGVGLNAAVNTVDITTRAKIGNDALVNANGTVAIASHDNLDIDKVTAGVAAGAVGVGMAAGVTVINQNTTAGIGSNTSVTGLGNGAGVTVDHGKFGTIDTTATKNGTDSTTTTPMSVETLKDTKGSINFKTMADSSDVAPVSINKESGSAAEGDHDEAVKGVAVKDTSTTVKGVAVAASNNSNLTSITAGIGAGAVGISLNAGVTVLENTAEATVDEKAKVNTLNTNLASNDQKVVIAAGNNLNYTAVTASLAGGAVGIAPAAHVVVAKLSTHADVNANATVQAKNGGVQITAESNERLLGISFGGAGGVVGIGGSVQVIRIDNNTGADVKNEALINTSGDVSISAIDSTKEVTFSGGVAGGLVGIGATVGVLTVYKNTAVAIDGDITAKNVSVLAENNDYLFQLAVAGGGGFVGVGGAVSILIYDADTNVEIGIKADINASGSITINSHSVSKVKAFTLGVAGGFVGVGGAVSIGKMSGGTSTTIAGNLNSTDTISIGAKSEAKLDAITLSGAGGFVGVSAGVSSWSMGGSAGTTVNGGDALNDPNNPNAQRPDDQANSKASSSTAQTADLLAKRQNSSSNIAPKSSNDEDRDNISGATGKITSENRSSTPGSFSGTKVDIRSSADITAGKDIQISAVGDVDVSQLTPSITGGAVAVGGAVNILNLETHVSTQAGGVINATGDVDVNSGLTEKVSMSSIGGQGGLVTVGAAVIYANDDSSVNTTINATGNNSRPASITGKNVSVKSTRNIESFDADIIKAGGGAIVVGGSFVEIDISSNGAGTVIGSGAQIKAAENLAVASNSQEKVKSNITPVSIGVGVFNGVVSDISVSNSAKVTIEDLSTLSAENVEISSYGDHTDRAHINSLGLGGINAGVFISDITNHSDADVSIGAASISGASVHIETSNNFDRAAYDMTNRPDHTTISGDSFSALGMEVHKSTVNLGTSDTDRFGSEITITGNAKISGLKTPASTGSPQISILAQTNIYLYEKAHAESVSAFGNIASVTSDVNVWTSSTITMSKGAFGEKGAEINNPGGQISLATLTNAMVYNIAESYTKTILLTVSHANANMVLNTSDLITLSDVNMKGNEVFIASGRVLGSSAGESSGNVNMIQSNNSAQGYATGTVGIPIVNSQNRSVVVNGIAIAGSSEIKSYNNITLDAEAGKNLFMSNYNVRNGSVAFIPIGDFEGHFSALPTQNSITIGNQSKVSAGVDNDQTVLILNREQAQAAGLNGTADISELTDSQIEAINALNLGTELKTGSTPLSAVRVSCDIDIPVGVGAIINHNGNFYKYFGIDLKAQNYDDTTTWELQDDDFIPPFFFYDRDNVLKNVALQKDDYVRYNNNYYRYIKLRNLETETYDSAHGWSNIVSDAEKASAVSSTIASDIKNTLKENIVLIKPKDMEMPELSYVNYVNYLEKRLRELDAWILDHCYNSDALARYEALRQMLELQLEELPSIEIPGIGPDGQPTTKTVQVTNALIASFGDIQASRGSVIINLTGSDTSVRDAVADKRLTAGAGATVAIHNSTPLSLDIGNITMKSNSALTMDQNGNSVLLEGGGIYLNTADISGSSGNSTDGSLVKIIQDDVKSNLSFGSVSLPLLTDIFVEGTILNEAGKVIITNYEGSINITGEIIALEQEISSKNSININAPGFYTIGANPKLLTETLWSYLRNNTSKTDGFPAQSTGKSDDTNENEKYTRTGGIVRAMGNITIMANHINVNGTIESGVSDLNINIARRSIIGIEYGNPVVTTRMDGIDIQSAAEVKYTVNSQKKTVEIEDIITRSGNIILCGDLFNTNPTGGNIKIAQGYANISMNNTTEYALIVNKIDTSRKNTGSITLYDTMRDNKTIYRYSNGQISRDVYDVMFDEDLNLYKYVKNDGASGSVSGNVTSYQPKERMFLIWVEGQGSKTTVTERWEKKSFNLTPGFFPGADSINDILKGDGHLVSRETVYTSGVQLKKSITLEQLNPGNADFDILKNRGVINDSDQVIHNYYGEYTYKQDGPPTTYVPKPEHHGGGWCQEETWVYQVQTITASTEYYSHYLYASNNFGIDFSGGHDASAINIQSKGNVLLQGNIITPENSTMTVKSQGEVKVAEGVIFSGVTPVIENANRDISLSVVISDKPLNISAAGNITINAITKDGSTSPLLIGSVTSTGGTVTINSATGVVAYNASSIIRGEKVYINAANGSIGEETLALKVDSNILGKNAGGVAALAQGNIYLTESTGDMRLIKQPVDWKNASSSIESLNGNVFVTSANGSIINGLASDQINPNVQGKKIILTTGGSGEITNVQIGQHQSLYMNSASDISIVSTGDINIGNIATGKTAFIAAAGNIIDCGLEHSAVLAVGGLKLDSKKSVRGKTVTDAFNVQLGTAAELTIQTAEDSWVNQVAQNGTLRGANVVTYGMFVRSASSGTDIKLSTDEGNLTIDKVTAAENIILSAAEDILDGTPDDEGIVANADTANGNIFLTAGNTIGQDSNFFDITTINGNLTFQSGQNSYIYSPQSLSIASGSSTDGDMIISVGGDAIVTSIIAANGTAVIDADNSILNGRTDGADVISAQSIVLNAESGTIGTSANAFAVDSSNGTVTAEAYGEVFITENSGIMNVNSIKSQNSEVTLSSTDGIIDANSNFDLGLDAFGITDLRLDEPVTKLNVSATTIRLISSQGGIGTLADALEIDVYGERTGRIFADAEGDISIDEIIGSMNTGTVVSNNGTIALGTSDKSESGQDMYLDGSSIVRAYNGSIHLRAGDNLYHLSGAAIFASQTVFIYGDFDNADIGLGSEIIIKGSITAGLINISGNDDNDTILLDVRDNNSVNGRVEVYGGKGEDTITAVKLDNPHIHLYGQDDNDTIIADSMINRVHIYGGAGNDTIRGGQAGDIIFGGSDDDTIDGAGGTDFIFGDGGQVLDGLIVMASDTLSSGKDTIDGGTGDDIIAGDNGVISVNGVYSGENSVDRLLTVDTTVSTLGDNDQISGGTGNDLISGGAGSDTLDGGDGSDIMIGDSGVVTYNSVNGISQISTISNANQSAGGNDYVYGGNGADQILAGAGSDTVNSGTDNGADIVIGDTGTITFETVQGKQVVKSISTLGETAGAADSITTGEGTSVVIGGADDDTISTGNAGNIVTGDNGEIVYDNPNPENHHVNHITVSDIAIGGKDIITTGSGSDIVIGGIDNDFISSGAGEDIVLGDNGTIQYVNGTMEIIRTTEDNTGGNDTITGLSGNKIFMGGFGDDILTSQDGKDIIFGDGGIINYHNGAFSEINNTNRSDGGVDIINSGAGDDIILGGAAGDSIDSGSDSGSDIVLGDTGKIAYEVVQNTPVVKNITTIGQSIGGADTIITGAGTDVIMGGAAGDTIITGDTGSAIVTGDNGEVVYDNPNPTDHLVNHITVLDVNIGGKDTITTGSGSDIIIGGVDDDVISSGAGEDIAIGDNGTVQYVNGIIDFIKTTEDGIGGNDSITGLNDDKVYMGGFGNDTITSQKGDDIVFGDGGIVDYNNGTLIEANGNGVKYGGADTIDTGIGENTVIGGLGDDKITTGIDRQSNNTDLREKYSNDKDMVIGDNGRRTFNGTGQQVDNRDTAIMSFNFQGAASKGIASTQKAGAPGSKVTNWINLTSTGPASYGNDPTEIIALDNGQRVDGLTLSWGGKERHRTDSISLNSYSLDNYNPDTIKDPATGILSPGDGYLFAGGIRTSAPNTQFENKLEVEMDGLNKYFKEYSVIVYLDAPSNLSTLVQNPSVSPIGQQYGRGESIRKVNISSASKNDSFYIDDAADSSKPAYNTYNGTYIKALAKDALSAYGKYANYVVFDGLTDDRFVVTITDGVVNISFNGLDLPSIAGIQIVGKFQPVDNITSSPTEAGGNDIISTSGGDDIVIGGAGADSIATFGDIRDGINDADTVIGDNGSVTVMNRYGFNTQTPDGQWVSQSRLGEVVNAKSTGFDSVNLNGVSFNDTIFTGNGNDVVIGGDGQDRINTQRQDDIASTVWGGDETDAPEAMKSSQLSALQNFETSDIKVVSVNFSYANSNNPDFKIPDDQYAGVVAAKNWNNLSLRDELNPNQYPNPYNNTSFKSNDGTVLSGLNFNLYAKENNYKNQLQADLDGHNQIHPDSANSRLFESYYWAQKQQEIEININNIGNQTGFDIYDVYVYIDGENERTEDDNFVFEVKGGDLANINNLTKFYLNDWRGSTFNGEFKEVTATSYEVVNNGVVPNMEMVGNYLVFRNVTAKNFALRIKNLKVGDQSPLNMPTVSGIQIVAGSGRTKVATNSDTGNVPRNGDYDKDVVIGDNGTVNFKIDVPYGTKDNVVIAQNKAYEVISDTRTFNNGNANSQNDFIVTGKNQDLVLGGNGADMIDSGEGDDVVMGDNAQIEMVDYNPIGVRQPLNLKLLDVTSYDNDVYVGKTGTTADQFKSKINSGKVPGVKPISSSQGGMDVIEASNDNDLVYGMENNDALIGNEGDDVLFDTTGTNKLKDKSYTSKTEFQSDMADVYTTLDGNAVLALKEFIENNYGKTSTKGINSTR